MDSGIYISNKNNKIDSFLQFITTLLLILSSKTVVFGIVYANLTLFAALCFCVILLCRQRKKISINNKNSKTLFLFVVFFLILMLMFIDDIQKDFNGYVGAVVLAIEVFATGMLAVTALDKKKFIKYYVNIIVVICIISLVFFSATMASSSFASSMVDKFGVESNRYVALPWHTFGWKVSKNYTYIFDRNAGMWWEPGAFQGFIVLAVLFTITHAEYFKRTAVITVILLITLLTTQSTAGYIILILSVMGFSTEYIECVLRKKSSLSGGKNVSQTIMILIGLLFAIALIQYVLSTGNIDNKLSEDSGSFVSRLEDIISSIKLIFDNPIIGIGLGESGRIARENEATVNTATTILYLASIYGIPFTIFYLYKFFKGIVSIINVRNIFQKVVLILLFTVLLMTETLYLLPIYAMFLYEWDA